VVFEDFLRKQHMANIWDASYFSVAESLYPLLLVMVVYIFPYSKITEAAIIFAIVDLIQRSIGPIKDISGKIANIQRALAGMTRVQEFLKELQVGSSSDLHRNSQLVNFDSVQIDIAYFKYPSSERNGFSLNDIHFIGRRGQLIGMVGPSGSGKSTILNIIGGNIIANQIRIRLRPTDGGREFLFPGDMDKDVVKYREQVGIVSQESHVFSESLAFNITLTQNTPSDFDQFWKWISSEITYLKEWGIKPETILDPSQLSVGQKQLLAAIRSCYLKKVIVLFDEISSALDSKLERALKKVVLLARQNSFTMIVAHRIETIIAADKILVVDDGGIISMGRHYDLLEASPLYRDFIKEITALPTEDIFDR